MSLPDAAVPVFMRIRRPNRQRPDPALPLQAGGHRFDPGSRTYSLPVEPEEFISRSAWEQLSHQEQDAYYERFSESLRAVLQGRNSDRALLFADHWDDLASWTRSAWNVMLENADQLEARLEVLATSPELSEADRSWAAESLDKARARREHKREAEDL